MHSIDPPVREEASGDSCTSLAEDTGYTARTKFSEGGPQVETGRPRSRTPAREPDDLAPGPTKKLDACLRGGFPHEDQNISLPLHVAHEARSRRSPRVGVEDDPKGWCPRLRLSPGGQERIVGEHGPDPHHDPLHACTQPVCLLSGFRPRQHGALTRTRRDGPVQGERELQLDPGRSATSPCEESGILPKRLLLGQQRPTDIDPGRPQDRAPPSRALPRIGCAVDHPRHPCGNEGAGAGRGAAFVGTGLETDVDAGATGCLSRLPECLHLGVWASDFSMPTFGHGTTIPDDDTAHHGIRVDPAPSPSAELHRSPQMGAVLTQ